MNPTVHELYQDGFKVAVDITKQVLFIDISDRRFLNSVHAVMPKIEPGQLLPAAALIQKAKQFDDGLYACIELLCQHGSDKFIGKAEWLSKLPRQAEQPVSFATREALATIHSACGLGGVAVAPPQAEIAAAVREKLARFWQSPEFGKPISFYTWTPDLRRIFAQDRLLQLPLDASVASEIVSYMRSDSAIRRAYLEYVDLCTKLTNPFENSSLARFVLSETEQPNAEMLYSVLPAAQTPETSMLKKLFKGPENVPNDFSVIDEVISQLRTRQLNLQPSPNSGWYDYCLWAIEPLAIPDRLPESNKVIASDLYRRALLDLFKGAYSLTRETHCKGGELCWAGSPRSGVPAIQLRVSPQLTIEPLPSLYYRRAIAYRFIRNVLESAFERDLLQQVSTLREDGTMPISLWDELCWMEYLFLGAHATSSDEIGMNPFDCDSDVDLMEARTVIRDWMHRLHRDPDLGRDARMMVPVFYDQQRNQYKVWVFLGWMEKRLEIRFERNPEIVSVEYIGADNKPATESAYRKHRALNTNIVFNSTNCTAQYPVTAEIYVNPDMLMNREEFRRFCDSRANVDVILSDLSAPHYRRPPKIA